MRKKSAIYKASINPDDERLYLRNIDPVDEPAIEREFILLSKDGKVDEVLFKNNTEQRIAVGAVLVPNRLIKRVDETTGEVYYITFDAQTIANARLVFFRSKSGSNAQLNHTGANQEGVHIVDSWLVKNPQNDLANDLGFKDIVAGSWYAAQWFENKLIWDEYIKTGKLKGFSIQGKFQHDLLRQIDVPVFDALSKAKSELLHKVSEVEILLNKFKF